VTWARQAAGAERAAAIGAAMDSRAGAVLDLAASPSTIRTTSAGRLFDAVAALLGGRTRVTYEGQAAIELEALAAPVPAGAAQRYPVEQRWEDGQLVLDPTPLVAALMELTPGAPAAAAFHESFGRATAEAAAGIARGRGLATVALTGGVFQNARLTRIVATALRAEGCEVLLHRSVPPGDGGISVGQAAVAAHRLD
jgi:hydrogenase maturation protein HypF